MEALFTSIVNEGLSYAVTFLGDISPVLGVAIGLVVAGGLVRVLRGGSGG